WVLGRAGDEQAARAHAAAAAGRGCAGRNGNSAGLDGNSNKRREAERYLDELDCEKLGDLHWLSFSFNGPATWSAAKRPRCFAYLHWRPQRPGSYLPRRRQRAAGRPTGQNRIGRKPKAKALLPPRRQASRGAGMTAVSDAGGKHECRSVRLAAHRGQQPFEVLIARAARAQVRRHTRVALLHRSTDSSQLGVDVEHLHRLGAAPIARIGAQEAVER